VPKYKIQEIKEEIKDILTGRRNLLDSLLPPLLFVIVNELVGFDAAMWSALAVAFAFAVLRLVRGQSALSALGGIGGVFIAIFLAKWMGRDESFFLPGILSNLFWVVLFVASLLIGKPLLAWGSYFLRKWPLEWYWHPRVRPAYMEVSLMWLVFMAARSSLQIFLYNHQAAGELAILTLVTGVPATILLLVASYVYGNWRLGQLGGPSVEEYQSGTQPPWTGQGRGF